jgi:hypothetical protein
MRLRRSDFDGWLEVTFSEVLMALSPTAEDE